MDIQLNFDYREADLEGLPLYDLAAFVLESEGEPASTEVSVSFVTDARIAELNERYRGKKGPTDVLSFECDNEDEPFAQPEGGCGPFVLGDVIIAPDVAQRQTEEFGTTFEEEISLLLVHGLLHLCGYDHVTDEDAERMEALEKKLLNAWTERGEAVQQ